MGVFYPHIQEIEQNENKENGKSAENMGKNMDNVLDYQLKLVYHSSILWKKERWKYIRSTKIRRNSKKRSK